MAGKNSQKNEFVEYLLELLSVSGELRADALRARAMFGGYGLYYEDIMFALTADDVLYLKTGDNNRSEVEARKLKPFSYERGGSTITMSYHEAPVDALDDSDEIAIWARAAILAATLAADQKDGKQKTHNKIKNPQKK